MRRIDWPGILFALLKIVMVLAALALGFWIWWLRVDYCMQQSTLAWWQCVLVSGGK